MSRRLAYAVISVVFANYLGNAFSYVLQGGPTPARIGTSLACLLTIGYLQLRVFSRPGSDLRSAKAYLALGTMAGLVYVPYPFFSNAWAGMPGFLAGSALLVLPGRVRWSVFGAIALSNGAIRAQYVSDPAQLAYYVVSAMVAGMVVYGLSRLPTLVKQLETARSELADLAVSQERLRFARDLHDLLGYSLSAITLKSELTHRLAGAAPDRARQELTEVLEISRQALADVRSVALSCRELSFNEETQSAQALLSAADIEVTVRIDACDQLPKEARVTLATVLREGVTNLLRHSKAEHCEIVLSSSRQLVTMDIINDGIPVIERKSRDGSGIGNLTTRVRALGGDLHAGLTPEHTYRLRAEIPLTASR
ncbi:sensor histidine kinase [Lentzea sp. E54]|uniref:sensor histidine kinase n=1 Tax=Lentzea xerophila TaxID=3435883 RepID=UPI003DA34715